MSIGTQTNAPTGLRPYGNFTSSVDNGGIKRLRLASGYATSLYTGDLVTQAADGTIIQATIGGPAIGVFWGCSYIDANGKPVDSPYWTGATVTLGTAVADAYVITDPNQLFAIQVSSTGGTIAPPAFAGTDIFAGFNYALAAVTAFTAVTINGVSVTPANNPVTGSTLTGLSAMYLDYASLNAGAAATLNFKVIDYVRIPGNTLANYFMDVVVKINNHVLAGGTGTVGV